MVLGMREAQGGARGRREGKACKDAIIFYVVYIHLQCVGCCFLGQHLLGHRFLGCHFMSRRSSFSRSLFFFLSCENPDSCIDQL